MHCLATRSGTTNGAYAIKVAGGPSDLGEAAVLAPLLTSLSLQSLTVGAGGLTVTGATRCALAFRCIVMLWGLFGWLVVAGRLCGVCSAAGQLNAPPGACVGMQGRMHALLCGIAVLLFVVARFATADLAALPQRATPCHPAPPQHSMPCSSQPVAAPWPTALCSLKSLSVGGSTSFSSLSATSLRVTDSLSTKSLAVGGSASLVSASISRLTVSSDTTLASLNVTGNARIGGSLTVVKPFLPDVISARLITATSVLASKGTLGVAGLTSLGDTNCGSSAKPAKVNIVGPTTIVGGLLPDVITARLITATQALASKGTLGVTGATSLSSLTAGATTLGTLIVSNGRAAA